MSTRHPDGMSNTSDFYQLVIDLVDAGDTKDSTARAVAVMHFLERYVSLSSRDPEAWNKMSRALRDNPDAGTKLIELPFFEVGCTPIAVMRQHAVGHGGFHTGVLGRDGPALTWVYDCGAARLSERKLLSSAIKSFAFGATRTEKRRVDLLFVSHFDADHVSGLTELLAATSVATAVIPYLDEIDKMAVLFEAAANDADTPELITCMEDPARWFRERGVEHVVVVGQAGPDTYSRLAADAAPVPTFEAGRDQAVLVDPDVQAIDRGGLSDAPVRAGSAWVVSQHSGDAGEWCFLPYVIPADGRAVERLELALGELFETNSGGMGRMQHLISMLSDREMRSKIRQCYNDDELEDSNGISMSLYVGPFRDAALSSRAALRSSYLSPRSNKTGWLLAGDAKLRNLNHRNWWIKFFKALKPRIGGLMLPHHGSRYNFHVDLLTAIEERALVFGCERPRSDGQMFHEEVMDVLGDHEAHLVGDDVSTSLVQISGSCRLEDAIEWTRKSLDRWS